jgi:hypothetical protein
MQDKAVTFCSKNGLPGRDTCRDFSYLAHTSFVKPFTVMPLSPEINRS